MQNIDSTNVPDIGCSTISDNGMFKKSAAGKLVLKMVKEVKMRLLVIIIDRCLDATSDN